MNHYEAAEEAVQALKGIHGLSKIVLYGSVAKGAHKPDSDVDIALIVDDSVRLLPLDLEGYPLVYHNYLDKAREIRSQPHIAIYWESEYEDGISLGRDSLNGTGRIMFERRYGL